MEWVVGQLVLWYNVISDVCEAAVLFLPITDVEMENYDASNSVLLIFRLINYTKQVIKLAKIRISVKYLLYCASQKLHFPSSRLTRRGPMGCVCSKNLLRWIIIGPYYRSDYLSCRRCWMWGMWEGNSVIVTQLM